MKYSFALMMLVFCINVSAQTNAKPNVGVSPFADYSAEWNKPMYAKCNTAEKALYMSKTEKEVIYILNLIRMYPKQFATTVLKNYPEKTSRNWLPEIPYYQSLMDTLLKIEPSNLLTPDKECYISAECHATSTGVAGVVTHDRQTAECKKKQHYYGECCDYGHSTALEIVLSLLIDEGVPSLGHRWICLGSYNTLGLSIQPHKGYGHTAVLDFAY